MKQVSIASAQGKALAGLEETIRGHVCEELKLSPDRVTESTNLRELPGVESIKMLRVVAKIERTYDLELDDEVVFRVRTIRELAEAIQGLLKAKAPGA